MYPRRRSCVLRLKPNAQALVLCSFALRLYALCPTPFFAFVLSPYALYALCLTPFYCTWLLYGSEGLNLFERIKAIATIEKLETIKETVKVSKHIEDIEKLL